MSELRVLAWSFSAFDLWRTCPLKYKLSKIDKVPEPTPEAFVRGRKVHKDAETYLKREIDEMPASLAKFAGLMKGLRDIDDKMIEQKFAVDKAWKPTAYFGKSVKPAWLRFVLDAGVIYPDNTALVIDFKTGKKYGENSEQTELFAVGIMAMFGWVTEVETRLWFLDTSEETVATYHRKDYDSLRAKWEKMVEPMMTDRTFAPRPNDKCRWCHYARSKAGLCKFG